MADIFQKAAEYVSWDPNPETRAEIQADIDRKDEAALHKKLDERLEFGTAGLRGPMGAGYNKMNDLVVIQSTQGVAAYLLQQFGDKAKSMGFAIGYDHRKQGPNNSKQFAMYLAAVMLHQGFKVYLYEGFVATPLVPWCIEAKGCCGGVMVTASHNPKQDDGYKLYWDNGAQIISPHDQNIAALIEQNLAPATKYDISNLRSNPNCFDLTNELCASYFKTLSERLCRNREVNQSSDLKITYTAMHGVGHAFIRRSFEAFSLKPYIQVKEQIEPDPDFPTVAFPNPEEGKGALALAFATADANGSTLVIANDPDADRLAVAEKVNGVWTPFTGNEIGALLGHWQWVNWQKQNPGKSSDDVYMVASTVSSKMLRSMGDHEGFKFEETLTGFKWMGNRSDQLRKEGKTVIFSFEEAIGFCVGDVVKDKDGVCAGAVFGEMANCLHKEGKSVNDHLQHLYKTYGYFVTQNSYVKCYHKPTTETIFKRLRNNGKYWDSVGPYKITSVRDLTDGYDSTTPDNKPKLPLNIGGEMITYTFDVGATITLRTSGTEPKLKFYCEMKGADPRKTKRDLAKLVKCVVDNMLEPEKNGLERRPEDMEEELYDEDEESFNN